MHEHAEIRWIEASYHEHCSKKSLSIERDKVRSASHNASQCAGRVARLPSSTCDLPHSKPQIVRTDEDTIALVRRLAAHYPDAVIAGILSRQGRKTAYGHRFQVH